MVDLCRFTLTMFLLTTWAGCSPTRDNDGLVGIPGDSCAQDADCGPGLVCGAADQCALLGSPGTRGESDECTQDEDCRSGLLCNAAGRCDAQQRGGAGERCQANSSCQAPLLCNAEGACAATGSAGTAQELDACSVSEDCGLGLLCADGACTGLPKWSGADCSPPAEGPPRVLFKMSRGGTPANFFDAPFPNDARRPGGRVDWRGFPGLDAVAEPAQFVQRHIAALTEEGGAFGLNPAIIFRFSARLDYSSLTFGGDDATFIFVDITDKDGAGRRPRSRFFATTDRARYICHDWLGIRPSEGSPLEPYRTYAVFFRKGIKTDAGELIEQDTDLTALLGPISPEHPALSGAWQRYAGFRTWLGAAGIPAEDVVGATVFSTGNPRRLVERAFEAVDATDVAAVESITLCDGGTDSPCEGPDGRTCGDVNPLFSEVHFKLGLPNFLQGLPPYTEGGGTIAFKNGKPRLQRFESVCAAATVPRGDAPPEGWPVAIFMHDSGDHFRSFIDRGVAARLAQLGWAVVSYDGVLQGDRAGLEVPPTGAESAQVLDNPSRPIFARDHGLQAAMDARSLIRVVAETPVRAGAVNTRFNPAQIVLFAHGRGARAAVPALAYDPVASAGVLTSAGAGWVDMARLSRSPFNRGAALEIALADDKLNGMHPGLHLGQALLDPVDPMNFGPLLRQPPEGIPAKHLFMLQGVDDQRVPEATQNHLAIAARLPLVGEALGLDTALQSVEEGTARGNTRIGGKDITRAVKQYVTSEGDPADLAFESREAISDLNDFFESLQAGAPTIKP